MSSVCGRLEFKEAEPHLEISIKCSDGSKPISHTGSEDAQESDGDDTGYIDQDANEESKDEVISKPMPESLPLKSLENEGEDQNLATVLQDMFSESTLETLIPAIKGSREKHGLTSKKLTVSWAEDVYDPPPTIVSHTRGKKQQQKPKTKDNSKKTGKKGQKGSSNSSSRGSGSKEKKQSSRKHNRDKFDWVTQMPIVAASS